MYTVFDLESNGFRKIANKIWCISYQVLNASFEVIEKGSIPSPSSEDVERFFKRPTTFVGHNIIRFDIPILGDILGVKPPKNTIDTLGLSWYLYPRMLRHGLEFHGERLGFGKPVIEDWENLTVEEYVVRCEGDVEINKRLFVEEMQYLRVLYPDNEARIQSLIDYLNFKLDCALEQEENPLSIDVDLINKSLSELRAVQEEKFEKIIEVMPLDITYRTVNKPAKLFKANGEFSVAGANWFDLLAEKGYPQDHEEPIVKEVGRKDGNPKSSTQLKKWLFALGWAPTTFEARVNKAGIVNQVPQIYLNGEICPSIKRLFDIEPGLEHLDMVTKISHRIGVFEAFLEKNNGKDEIVASIGGLTNTLRFKHVKPIANLPSPKKFYGAAIRGSIIAPKGQLMCGSDMSALEDTTKQHFMYFHDPNYVNQMRVPGFDPHLDIAVLANMMTLEQANRFKELKAVADSSRTTGINLTPEEKVELSELDKIRGRAKTVNFSGIYGASPAKMAVAADMTLAEATKMHKTYWQRNKAVRLVEKRTTVKTVNFIDEQMWQYNPISKFWYSLRFEKDKFSTLNQGSGVFCFDMWVREVRSRGLRISLQYHDEIVVYLDEDLDTDIIKGILKDSIRVVNEKLQLNVPLDVSLDFGINYAEVH